MLTLADRAAAYARAFPQYPASHLSVVSEQGKQVLYGRWVLGADYRAKAGYYGEYPPGYLQRVLSLFPDAVYRSEPSGKYAAAIDYPVAHVFAGSVPRGPWVRVDMNHALDVEVHGSVYNLADHLPVAPWLVLADPPYSAEDAKQYGTPAVNRGRALAAIARAIRPGGFLCWLDTCWPMHRKAEWRTVGRIAVTRSTNHRLRDLTIFERRIPT